ncbi:MAG: hypothetical protein HY706_09590 [Candidatus Hydrogenedentes bacterium]|nr:hypothetical protein [Candidatus Hydrogenedentota bacterium]
MSYQIGMNAICLRPDSRLAHTEYCSHDPLMRHVRQQTGLPFVQAWQYDFVFITNDGPVPWAERGRTTDMGHAEFQEGGLDRRDPKPCPFRFASEVYAFDAVQEYGLPDADALVDYYEKQYQQGQKTHTDQVFTAGYYKTIVSGAIEAFGWEMLLTAAADSRRFERVLDSIFRLSLHHYEAWARTSAPVFICHDDMVWTQGPFMDPSFYRAVIFPRYKKLWSVLKAAGKKVLYCSDGDWTLFLDDIADAGADGFIFEPLVPLRTVAERFGKTHCIISSSVDCRTLTFGTRPQIQAQIDATLELAKDCPGFMFAVGNHIPSNVPLENALFFFDYLSQHWFR